MERYNLEEELGSVLLDVNRLCKCKEQSMWLGLDEGDYVLLRSVLYDGRWFVFSRVGVDGRSLACNRDTFIKMFEASEGFDDLY